MINLQDNSNKKQKSGNGFFFFLAVVFLLFVLFDQLSKFFLKNNFKNYQFAFSLPLPQVVIFGIYFVILVGMSIYLYSNFLKISKTEQVAWISILAGAFSNIGERIFLGYVRDFIYIFSGIFNLADFYIMVGVLILFFSKERQAK